MPQEITAGQRWFRRGIKAALFAAVLVGLTLAWPEQVIEVRTAQVARGEVEDIVPSLQAGAVKSKREVSLRANAIGQVAKLLVQHGDRVKEGQLLVELENNALLARLKLAKANLNTGESTARTAALRLDLAKHTLDRSKQLADKGALASQALERAQAEYDLALESVTTAQANLGELRAAVEVAQAAVEDTRLKAPFGGLVSSVAVEKGESLAMGSPVLDLVDDSTVTVVATVDEADVGRLKLGMPVRVHTDAFPNQPFAGTLTWISPVVIRDIRQNRHLDVEVGLDGASAQLKVGLSTDIEIVVDRRDNVLYIPSNAIMRKGEIQQVYALSSGRAHLRNIRTGLSNWERSEVLDGLREGERIVLSLSEKGLKDGVRVQAPGSEATTRVAF